MVKKKKRELHRLNVHHNKLEDTVFVSYYDELVSGTLEITPEQAIAIGDVGRMALTSREQKEKSANG